MSNDEGSPSSRGFLFGALQKINPSSGKLAPVNATHSTDSMASPNSESPRVQTAPLPLQETVPIVPSPPGGGVANALPTDCGAQKMGYRQCLELNPDGRVNCTWALDNYLKCKEGQR